LEIPVRDLAAILTEHEGKDVSRLDPLQPVWDVRVPGPLSRNKNDRLSNVTACRSAVWRAILSSSLGVFICHQDPPDEDEVAGSWHQEGKRTWRVPTGFNPAEASTQYWLFLGGWTAYAAAAPIEEIGTLFNMTPERVTEWARRHQVEIVIDSYLDDLEWRVFVGAR